MQRCFTSMISVAVCGINWGVKSTVSLLAATFFCLLPQVAQADSPPNLSYDIPWADTGGVFDLSVGAWEATFNGVADTMAAFNNGRRQEEIQFGLANGALGTLDLPSQAVWDALSDDDKALFIINEERIDRGGMLPGVIGLPLEGLEANIDAVAQSHAQAQVDQNLFAHVVNDIGPSARIANYPALANCHEFLSRSENLAAFFWPNTQAPLYIERSIYGWVYADATSAWGHREAVLLQDLALGSTDLMTGFKDNVGPAGSEGFMGIGVVHSATYDPFGFGVQGMGTLVVQNIFDPSADNPDCGWRSQGAATVATPVPTDMLAPTATLEVVETPIPQIVITPTLAAITTPLVPTATVEVVETPTLQMVLTPTLTTTVATLIPTATPDTVETPTPELVVTPTLAVTAAADVPSAVFKSRFGGGSFDPGRGERLFAVVRIF